MSEFLAYADSEKEVWVISKTYQVRRTTIFTSDTEELVQSSLEKMAEWAQPYARKFYDAGFTCAFVHQDGRGLYVYHQSKWVRVRPNIFDEIFKQVTGE